LRHGRLWQAGRRVQINYPSRDTGSSKPGHTTEGARIHGPKWSTVVLFIENQGLTTTDLALSATPESRLRVGDSTRRASSGLRRANPPDWPSPSGPQKPPCPLVRYRAGPADGTDGLVLPHAERSDVTSAVPLAFLDRPHPLSNVERANRALYSEKAQIFFSMYSFKATALFRSSSLAA